MHNDKITPKEVAKLLLNFGNQFICKFGINRKRDAIAGRKNMYRNIFRLQFTIVIVINALKKPYYTRGP